MLELLGLEGSDKLIAMAKSVLSDDSSGREAAATSFYFRKLIPDGTRRESEVTAALDYGYAVLRAGIGRCAVGGGWLVSKGMHHCSAYNAFNLVDDLIEPFRPVVDLLVLRKVAGRDLDSSSKQILAGVFEYCVMIGDRLFTVQSAIEEMLESFKRAVLGDDAALLALPELVELKSYAGEEK